MGGGNADKSRMKYGDNAAAAANQSQQFGAANQTTANQINDQLLGKDSQIAKFLTGNDLKTVEPSGVYKLGMDNSVKAGEREFANANQGITGEVQNRGFGIDAGSALDALRKNALARAGMKGEAYTGAVAGQHNEALNNFWSGASLAGSQATNARDAAVSATGNAGQTYGNVYGTAAQYHPSQMGQIVGSALGAAGTVGAAAMTGGGSAAAGAACPAKGSMILMADGSYKPVEELKQGDEIMQMNGYGKVVRTPQPVKRICTDVMFHDGRQSRVSEEHSWSIRNGGYIKAKDAHGVTIAGFASAIKVETLKYAGEHDVYPLTLTGDHTYCADGAWSLE
jgi:hypothetical protein